MATEDLFIATCRDLKPGDVILGAARTLSTSQDACENKLASHALSSVHDRRTGVFASNDSSFAAGYLMSENRTGCEPKLYVVKMPAPSRHPMVLINLVCEQADPKCVALLAKEYWAPTDNWKCWEFIDQQATVVRPETWPDMGMLAGARYRYGLDLDAGKRMCA